MNKTEEILSRTQARFQENKETTEVSMVRTLEEIFNECYDEIDYTARDNIEVESHLIDSINEALWIMQDLCGKTLLREKISGHVFSFAAGGTNHIAMLSDSKRFTFAKMLALFDKAIQKARDDEYLNNKEAEEQKRMKEERKRVKREETAWIRQDDMDYFQDMNNWSDAWGGRGR